MAADPSSASGYEPLFDPDAETQPFDDERAARTGDRAADSEATTGEVPYVYDERIVLAINVALAAGRPLLVRGQPGTGKSSLAFSVAAKFGWPLHAVAVSSRTTARDLLWSFDAVARLAAAQAHTGKGDLPDHRSFVTPGVLWRAFDPESAAAYDRAESRQDAASARSVVLIDEIDKADPDFPNDLLVPLGSYRFRDPEGNSVVAARPPLIIITTNEERELPRAFLRRCVILELSEPSSDRLGVIARAHFDEIDDEQLDSVRTHYLQIRKERLDARKQPPSVAEFLDALAALRGLRLSTSDHRWPELKRVLLDKATAIPAEQP